MAKKVRRLYALGNSIVQVENGEIIHTFDFDENVLLNEVDEIINKVSPIAPNEIFKKAIKNLIGDDFINISRKLVLDKNEYVIHDQRIYKVCANFIMNDERFKKQQEFNRERTQKRKKFFDKESIILSYERRNRDMTGNYIRRHKRSTGN